ncbi:MAG: prolyl oligopeptidase family serine peptidase [Spirochaetes bacterium]|nr:prolyl oligopeptidase family serine peptidase [Spirochaetota bacterium]
MKPRADLYAGIPSQTTALILLFLLTLSCGSTQDGAVQRLSGGITTITLPETLAPAADVTADEQRAQTPESGEDASKASALPDAEGGAGGDTSADTAKEQKKVQRKMKKIKKRQRTPRDIEVDIFVPKNRQLQGDMLILPGWKFSRKRWQQETDLLKLAEEHGLRLVFPEMTVTLYETQYFPETILKWAATPGGTWISRVLIPTLQEKYGLFRKGNRNFVLGLSTGGRGVVMTALNNPGLFTAGAALSGDFNQLAMPHDRLITAIYGPYRQFMRRWYGVDNPEVKIITGKWDMPLYIGHGKMDRIVPFEQSKSLHDAIVKYHPKTPVRFSAPDKEGHDFGYWRSEVPPVVKFFLEQE